MTFVSRIRRWLPVPWALSLVLLTAFSAAPPHAESPRVPYLEELDTPPEVQFMRGFVQRVNPSLRVEDPECAAVLPGAIHRYAREHGLDWQRILALAWQESDFDCHAKNRRDRGGAYGPFQIRRLWEPVIGDPRPQYFDPELAVERVVQVILYYRETARFDQLVERRFRYPLLCLYNSGESRRVNMPYCRQVGRKMARIEEAWSEYRAGWHMDTQQAVLEPTVG